MHLTEAATPDGKSGEAEGSAVLPTLPGYVFGQGSAAALEAVRQVQAGGAQSGAPRPLLWSRLSHWHSALAPTRLS
jgi:hypothetical protein